MNRGLGLVAERFCYVWALVLLTILAVVTSGCSFRRLAPRVMLMSNITTSTARLTEITINRDKVIVHNQAISIRKPVSRPR